MRYKDFTGETYYLIPTGNGYKLYPFSADILKALGETLKYVQEIKDKKEKNKCYAV